MSALNHTALIAVQTRANALVRIGNYVLDQQQTHPLPSGCNDERNPSSGRGFHQPSASVLRYVRHPGVFPAIRDLHARLCRRGKPRKVVLVAAMRKPLLILNAVVRDRVPW